ncbi:MAG: pyridoxamine 5'-phosphate oxidase family protein [Ktedonobacterales bacterium]
MAQATLDLARARDAHIAARLRDDLIIWLATTRPDGRPHLVPVWFHWDGATILIFSIPNQKIRNLQHQAQVVLGLDNTDLGEDVVLIEGIAELLPRDEVAPRLAPYASKYAGKLQEMGWTLDTMAQSYTETIRISPTRFL